MKRTRRVVVVLVGGIVLAGAFHGAALASKRVAATDAHGLPHIRVLSTRADLVSGGDALVAVDPSNHTQAAELRVSVNGRDVTNSFKQSADGLLGLVDGLRVGDNDVMVRAADRRGPVVRLTIANHQIQGPLFAGPQVQPWICATDQFGLGPATDASCSAPTKYQFFYKSTAGGPLKPYDPAGPPADVANTTTDQGRTVPYIVRLERGVIDRGIYDIAVLFDPSKPWDSTAPQPAWNGKVLWPFGGDCQPNHVQPAPVFFGQPMVFDDLALSRGFAVASNGLNVLGADCNDVVSAEAMAMTKEHLIDRYGPVRYTIGNGCSGGSMQQHWIAANYPGLIDGIQPTCSFPDIWDTMQEAEDCSLLNRQFQQAPSEWPDPAQTAVTGHGFTSVCTQWTSPAGGYARIWLDPANGASCLRLGTAGASPPWVYNPVTNPEGVRCTLQDYQVALFGTREEDGFANRPFDNVGVQYGLQALRSGKISPEQFVALNANVGGYDIDWHWQPQRSQADPGALINAYRGGRVTYARQLARVPIIDLRGTANTGIHSDVQSYITRARLDAANGGHGNQIIWTTGGFITGDPTVASQSFLLIDKWLAAIEADHTQAPLEAKVLDDRPSDAQDACWIDGQEVTDQAQCERAYPHYALPRIAAGGPLANDILKCQLKPLLHSDYPVAFTDDQWHRLQATFPRGVCDYSRPGVHQRPSIPWLTYEAGPGGQPLGDPPESRPGQ